MKCDLCGAEALTHEVNGKICLSGQVVLLKTDLGDLRKFVDSLSAEVGRLDKLIPRTVSNAPRQTPQKR